MPRHRQADTPERFPLDSSEARFHEKIEQRIERNLASDRPALTREEVDQKARAVIASAQTETLHLQEEPPFRAQAPRESPAWPEPAGLVILPSHRHQAIDR